MRPAASIGRLILAAIMLALLACACRDSKIDRDLCAIEELTDLHADSAKKLLESGEFDHLTDSFQLAHRALSEVAIDYKTSGDSNYVNDSLIRVCRKHFENSKNLNHRIRFHYYAGLCAFDTDNYGAAIAHFLTVIECAKQIKSPFWQAMGNRSISNVYLWNDNYPEIARYAKRALKYFKQNDSLTNNSTWQYTAFMRWQLSSAYTGMGEYDKSMTLSNEGIKIGQDSNYTELYRNSTAMLATAYFYKKNYTEAARLYERVCSIRDPHMRNHYFMGLAYFYNGNYDKALAVYKKVPFNKGDNSFLHLNYLLKEKYDNAQGALEALKLYNHVTDSLNKMRVGRLYEIPAMDQYEARDRLAKEQLKNHQLRISILIIVIILLLIIGLFLFIISQSKNKRKLANYINITNEISQKLENEKESSRIMENKYLNELTVYKIKTTEYDKASEKIDNLTNIITANESKYNSRTHILSKLLQEKYHEFVEVCSSISEGKTSKTDIKRLDAVLNTIKTKFKANSEYINEIEQFVNISYDNLMSDLRNDVPSLEEDDYICFMLSAIGINISLLAEFTGKHTSAIYNQRRKIKNRIKGSGISEEKINLYLSHFSR